MSWSGVEGAAPGVETLFARGPSFLVDNSQLSLTDKSLSWFEGVEFSGVGLLLFTAVM